MPHPDAIVSLIYDGQIDEAVSEAIAAISQVVCEHKDFDIDEDKAYRVRVIVEPCPY